MVVGSHGGPISSLGKVCSTKSVFHLVFWALNSIREQILIPVSHDTVVPMDIYYYTSHYYSSWCTPVGDSVDGLIS